MKKLANKIKIGKKKAQKDCFNGQIKETCKQTST